MRRMSNLEAVGVRSDVDTELQWLGRIVEDGDLLLPGDDKDELMILIMNKQTW